LRMANSPHFLGYSMLGSELTKDKVDFREQWDFGTEHVCRWEEGGEMETYWRLWGPSQVCWFFICTNVLLGPPDVLSFQWPAEDDIPGFRRTFQTYLDRVQVLSRNFVSLVSEAFGLGPDGLNRFYDEDKLMQHRAKVQSPFLVSESQGIDWLDFFFVIEPDREISLGP
jgi:isopenicillin N synthase-like dioxygenase